LGLLETLGEYNLFKYQKIKDNPFFQKELDLLKIAENLRYYGHIINNVKIESNTKNSYILWVFDKVEDVDEHKPCKITSGSSSLPDVDLDVPRSERGQVLSHLQDTYGRESVAQMVTFSELQGRSAITTVMRANSSCGFDEMKEITMLIPERAKVDDQMEAVGENSLIRWTLEYMPDRLGNYARLEDDKVVGDYAEDFEQAIRLEGTRVDLGKHASAIIVYDGKISDVCPMINDKSSDEKITGFSMEDGEAVGLVKLDVLGLLSLDKLMLINELIDERERKDAKQNP
jgi:DNA polymerase III alpha subunit